MANPPIEYKGQFATLRRYKKIREDEPITLAEKELEKNKQQLKELERPKMPEWIEVSIDDFLKANGVQKKIKKKAATTRFERFGALSGD